MISEDESTGKIWAINIRKDKGVKYNG